MTFFFPFSSLQYFILFSYFLPPLLFFLNLLNSESGGAPFLAQEEIMHYTGQVSQLFTKKLV